MHRISGLRYELERAGFAVERVEPGIGMLVSATYCRTVVIGGLTRRIPLTGWLRPIIYLFGNLRMGLEDAITPRSAVEAFPLLLLSLSSRR